MSLLDMFRSNKASNAGIIDPFDHPEVMRMSERELADLPWPRFEPGQGAIPDEQAASRPTIHEEPVDNLAVNTFCV